LARKAVTDTLPTLGDELAAQSIMRLSRAWGQE